MKTIFLSIVSIFLFSSCQSTDFNPRQASAIVISVVPPATKLAVTKKPDTKKYFLAVADAIDIFALNQDLTPTALQNIINTSKIKELETPESLAVITTLVNLYKGFYSDIVSQKLDEKNLKDLLNAISTSIREGLMTDTKNPVKVQ
jgi:hypothetical protein